MRPRRGGGGAGRTARRAPRRDRPPLGQPGKHRRRVPGRRIRPGPHQVVGRATPVNPSMTTPCDTVRRSSPAAARASSPGVCTPAGTRPAAQAWAAAAQTAAASSAARPEAPAMTVRASRRPAHRAPRHGPRRRCRRRAAGAASEPRRQPVASGGGDLGGDAAHVRERAMQQHRVGVVGAVAVEGADRAGEPAQFAAAAAARAVDPRPVLPAERAVAEGVVVAAGAGRPARPVHGDVQLLDHVELLGQGPGQQPGQARSHRRTGTTSGTRTWRARRRLSSSRAAMFLRPGRRRRTPRRRRHRGAARPTWRAGGGGRARRRRPRPGPPAARRGGPARRAHCPPRRCVAVVEQQVDAMPVVEGRRGEPGRDPAAGDAAADDADQRPRRMPCAPLTPGGSPLRASHLPSCGGTPPLPWVRSAAAIDAARNSAPSARRSSFTGGTVAPAPACGPDLGSAERGRAAR